MPPPQTPLRKYAIICQFHCSKRFSPPPNKKILYETPRHIINPRRACAARVTMVALCVCLCVCLSVYNYSHTTGYEAAYKRYQQLQCNKGMKINVAIFAETTAFERYCVKTSEKANMHNEHWLTSSPLPGLACSEHGGGSQLRRRYVYKSSTAENPHTIMQLACEMCAR